MGGWVGGSVIYLGGDGSAVLRGRAGVVVRVGLIRVLELLTQFRWRRRRSVSKLNGLLHGGLGISTAGLKEVGGWVGGWVGGKREGRLNALLDPVGRWVGGWAKNREREALYLKLRLADLVGRGRSVFKDDDRVSFRSRPTLLLLLCGKGGWVGGWVMGRWRRTRRFECSMDGWMGG